MSHDPSDLLNNTGDSGDWSFGTACDGQPKCKPTKNITSRAVNKKTRLEEVAISLTCRQFIGN